MRETAVRGMVVSLFLFYEMTCEQAARSLQVDTVFLERNEGV